MDAETAARKAAAERDALLGLAAILTHDLSNPLQSVTVLCELGMDDEDPGEGPRRSRQCLEAAERMRTLIHSYASLVRSVARTAPVATTLERVMPLFTRRLERHRIEVETRLESDVDAPAGFGFAMLGVFLGIVRIADQSAGRRHSVTLTAHGEGVQIELAADDGATVTWPEDLARDTAAILAGTAEVSTDEASLRIRFEGPSA